ncbi:MAG: chemotaxis protein CheB [Bacteroidota bacterium]|nr:chemotaxis protein CheB [Bacteroidota bacterium]
MKFKRKYELIVIGTSNGGVTALIELLKGLSPKFNIPIVIVIHLGKNSLNQLCSVLQHHTKLKVKEPDEKEVIRSRCIYLASPGYHLLIEPDRSFSYCASEPVNFSRPSIDVLFESAADAFTSKLVGVILTGANTDGTKGLFRIKHKGGLLMVQDPNTAQSSEMPASAIRACDPDFTGSIKEITIKMNSLLFEN